MTAWYNITGTNKNSLKTWSGLEEHGKKWEVCGDSRALSSHPKDNSLERTDLVSTWIADQRDEGLRFCGHGALIDEYLLDIELLQGVGRCRGACAQDDIVARQFIRTSFLQDIFVPGDWCRRHQVTHSGNISRFLMQEPGRGCTSLNDYALLTTTELVFPEKGLRHTQQETHFVLNSTGHRVTMGDGRCTHTHTHTWNSGTRRTIALSRRDCWGTNCSTNPQLIAYHHSKCRAN